MGTVGSRPQARLSRSTHLIDSVFVIAVDHDPQGLMITESSGARERPVNRPFSPLDFSSPPRSGHAAIIISLSTAEIKVLQRLSQLEPEVDSPPEKPRNLYSRAQRLLSVSDLHLPAYEPLAPRLQRTGPYVKKLQPRRKLPKSAPLDLKLILHPILKELGALSRPQ
jgi:hypothetical protein